MLHTSDSRARIFLDTHVVTLFKFLEEPDSFIPTGESQASFVITMPVVRELERIKDEHFSKGQRTRARDCLSKLEEASESGEYSLSKRSVLQLFWREPSKGELWDYGLNVPASPDDQLIAAVLKHIITFRNHQLNLVVMSDDVGVRVRVKHLLSEYQVIASKPPDLRHKQESFELSRLVQEAVKALARELAVNMRDVEAQSKPEP